MSTGSSTTIPNNVSPAYKLNHENISAYLLKIKIFDGLAPEYESKFNNIGFTTIDLIAEQLAIENKDVIKVFDNKERFQHFLDEIVKDPVIAFPSSKRDHLLNQYANGNQSTTSSSANNNLPITSITNSQAKQAPSKHGIFSFFFPSKQQKIKNSALKLIKQKGDDALYTAISLQQNDEAIYIIQNSNDIINKALKNGQYPIHAAARTGNLEIFKYILSIDSTHINKTSADVNGMYAYPIHFAAIGDKLEMVKYILSIDNTNINKTNPNNCTPLIFAASCNGVDTVRYLLTLPDIDVNIKAQPENKTALEYAIAISSIKREDKTLAAFWKERENKCNEIIKLLTK